MSKVAVVYWSGTGNTEAMAKAVAEGAKAKGAEVDVLTCGEFSADKAAGYSGIAFGCPAMGSEVLEESEFQPMFDGVKDKCAGKKRAQKPKRKSIKQVFCTKNRLNLNRI